MVVTHKSQIGEGFFKPHVAALAKRVAAIHMQTMKAHHANLGRHVKAAGIRMRKAGSGAEMNKIKTDTKAAIKAKAEAIHQMALDKTDAAIEAAKTKVHNKIKKRICPEGVPKGSGWMSDAWSGVKSFATKMFHGVKNKVINHGTKALNQVKSIVKNAPENVAKHLNNHRADYMKAAWDGATDIYHNGKAGVANQAAKAHHKITKEAQKLVGCTPRKGAKGSGVRASGVRASGVRASGARRGRGIRASGISVRGGTQVRVVG